MRPRRRPALLNPYLVSAFLLAWSIVVARLPFYWLTRGSYKLGRKHQALVITRDEHPYAFWVTPACIWTLALAVAGLAVFALYRHFRCRCSSASTRVDGRY